MKSAAKSLIQTLENSHEWMAVKRALHLLRPREILSVSQWADRNRMLSPEASAEPGKWYTSRAEYQRGIMDAFSDPVIERIVVMSSAQIGKTEIMNCAIGYYIDHDPAPMLIVEPTLDVGKSWSKDRLSTMIRDTPCLTHKVSDVKTRDSGNTTLHKAFHGGHITIAGANSAASLRARPIRIVLCDDIDAFPVSAGSEGNPVELAVKRTTTFWNRKIGLFSTPTDQDASKIEAEYLKSDQRKYYIPCPHCDEYQILEFKYIKFPKGEPEKAHYECRHCGKVISDADKSRMIHRGEWRKHAPDVKRVAGFWINELYSPWVTFGEVATKFYKAKDDKMMLKVFINTSLGESWKQVVKKSDDSEIYKAKCDLAPQTIPPDAVAITCGIDQQMVGYWFVVRAWARDMTSWLIHYGYLPTKEDLDNLVFNTQYPYSDGSGFLPIWRVARDTGGTKGKESETSMTEEAYWWIVRNAGRGPMLFGTKGSSSHMSGRFKVGQPLLKTPSGKHLPEWFRVIEINTGAMKDYYFYGVEQAANRANNALYLHGETEENYVRQVTAEEKRSVDGEEKWVMIRKDNHLLDAEILCISLAMPQWVGGGVNLMGKPKHDPTHHKPTGRRVISAGVEKTGWFGR